MSTNYETPNAVRELEKMLRDFSYNYGYEINHVFDDTLRYIIWGFSLDGKPIENWPYKKVENKFFWNYMKEWIMIMQKQTAVNKWYDPFGDLFMSCVASNSRKSDNGQFFTPVHICDLMAEINQSQGKVGICCADPACGSGRTLLAWHVRNLGNYLCAEDIDRTCCLMTCCNFLIHGCIGEVIWHDSLNPDSFNYGWKINERLTYTGIPTIRSINKEESRVIKYWQEMKNNNSEGINTTEPEKKQKNNDQHINNKKPIQLTLF